MSERRTKRYNALIETLGMTQRGAARFLDLGERTSRRYASGDADVPLGLMMLLELMVAHEVSPAEARKLAGATDRNPDYSDQRLAEEE